MAHHIHCALSGCCSYFGILRIRTPTTSFVLPNKRVCALIGKQILARWRSDHHDRSKLQSSGCQGVSSGSAVSAAVPGGLVVFIVLFVVLVNFRRTKKRTRRRSTTLDTTPDDPPISLSVRPATSEPDLAAAAWVRAVAFHVFPPDRAFAAQRFHAQHAADETDRLRERVMAMDGPPPDFFLCLIATIQMTENPTLPTACIIRRQGELDEAVVGSLDLHVSPLLASERLVGRYPADASRRAYLSDVAVVPSLRRRGVAAALVHHAGALAAGMGVTDLYVHVIANNASASGLYAACGFQPESEEPADTARQLGRPTARRLLLHRSLMLGG
eukprot:TRINITY_DN14919_c0_g1_i1.p1 TRINITY_DN14919_c0_g1~~TRINITY_DN14919_c0_g1_i1.p1  ORF type:complete len:353 (+),score=11.44 TRINITY_DN14919_c0_g1_i1:74-1060(+)